MAGEGDKGYRGSKFKCDGSWGINPDTCKNLVDMSQAFLGATAAPVLIAVTAPGPVAAALSPAEPKPEVKQQPAPPPPAGPAR